MGITAKSKAKASDNWPGMGFLLVFFPAEDHHPTTTTNTTNTKVATLKRTNSHNNPILTKAQSTLSICVIILFISLLLFTLSTFEPTSTTTPPRRFLSYKKPPNTTNLASFWFLSTTKYSKLNNQLPLFALQGMGKLHMRGTRAMAELIVCHVSEDTNEDDFKLFLRLLYRSGLVSRADVVFLFPSSSFSLKFEPLITQENDSFLRLLEYYYYYYYYHFKDKKMNTTSLLGFDVTRFLKKKEGGEPLWGKKLRVVNNNMIYKNHTGIVRFNNESEGSNSTESTRPSYGSVVSFEASELDPENSLAGFLDYYVPMSLRRWACYPMLLGRVRKNFKHVMLVDVRSSLLMGDPLARARNRNQNPSPNSVYVFGKKDGKTGGKKNSDKTQSLARVDSTFLMGGARGVRWLSSSMLTEIARVAIQQQQQQHKRRNESGVLGQLVGIEHALKNVDLVEATESLPELSSLIGLSSNFNSSSRDFHYNWSVIQRGNGNIRELNSVIMKLICACEVDTSVYRDC